MIAKSTTPVLFLGALLTSQCVTAQVALVEEKSAEAWRITTGLGVGSAPRYPGASRTFTRAVPLIDARYKDWLTINFANGVEARTNITDNFTVGASVGADFTRRKKDYDEKLASFPDVGVRPMARVFASWRGGAFSIATEVRSRLGSSEVGGTTLSLELAARAPMSPSWTLMGGVSASAMDSRYAKTFFGVTAAQSASSGLSSFDAKRGAKDISAFVQSIYRINNDWSILARVRVAELVGDAHDSSITKQSRQVSSVVLLRYSFQ